MCKGIFVQMFLCVFFINTRISYSVRVPTMWYCTYLFICVWACLCTLSAVLQRFWPKVVMWRAASWESCHFSSYLWKRDGGRRARIKEKGIGWGTNRQRQGWKYCVQEERIVFSHLSEVADTAYCSVLYNFSQFERLCCIFSHFWRNSPSDTLTCATFSLIKLDKTRDFLLNRWQLLQLGTSSLRSFMVNLLMPRSL